METPRINPDFIYITSQATATEHGFAFGEQVRVLWQTIDDNKRDTNGLDIWVYSRNSRTAKPVYLVPCEYSLTPVNVPAHENA